VESIEVLRQAGEPDTKRVLVFTMQSGARHKVIIANLDGARYANVDEYVEGWLTKIGVPPVVQPPIKVKPAPGGVVRRPIKDTPQA
jgi:hypothetical protein